VCGHVCRVQSAECRVQSAECRVQSAECRVHTHIWEGVGGGIAKRCYLSETEPTDPIRMLTRQIQKFMIFRLRLRSVCVVIV
jgi:hypothetical protein